MLHKNDKAVSPVVATLILIIVAVIGAAAIGVILGTFSSDISKEANAEDLQSAASSELTVAGSTTVQIASELLAQEFMTTHPGIKVTVSGGGSDAGIAGAELGAIDIGSSSKDVDVTGQHPALQKFQIGGRGIVFVARGIGSGANEAWYISRDAAYKAYDIAGSGTNAGKVHITMGAATHFLTSSDIGAPTGAGDTTVFQRAGGSDTEATVAEWFDKSKMTGYLTGINDFKTAQNLDASTALGVTGNRGVTDAINSETSALGFIDYGFAVQLNSPAHVLNITSDDTGAPATVYMVSDQNIKDAALKGEATYEPGLVGPLYYLTKGQPIVLEKSFIDYARSPDGAQWLHMVGLYHISDL